ncbi:MAG: hypothetical protein OH344_05095, partial [Candidatus Parvarchaeota archaeon]|nr:hypothetical protein [Candidatus Jingweiarchaeum tengchongense]
DKQRSLFFEESANLALSKNIDLKKVANLIINKKYPENLTPTKLIEWIEDQEKVPVLEEKKLQEIILQKLAQNPKAVEGYKKGKLQALGIIVGEIKKDTGIIVTPEQIAGIIDKKG